MPELDDIYLCYGAAGEYISVYSQKDSQEADMAKEKAAQQHVRPSRHTCSMHTA